MFFDEAKVITHSNHCLIIDDWTNCLTKYNINWYMEWVKWSLNWWYVLYLQIKLINCSLLKATLNVVWGVVAGKTFLYDDGKLRLFFYDKRKTKQKKNIHSEISFVIALFIIWVYNVHSNSLLQKLFNSVEIERLLGSLDDFLKFGSQLQKGPLILLPWYVMPQKDVKGYQHHNVFTNITKTLRNKRNLSLN